MALTYNDYIAVMQSLLVIPVDDPDFNVEVPRMIDNAEWRIIRDLDLIVTSQALTGSLTAGSRNASAPAAMMIVETANVITPVGTTNPDNGTRNPCERVSLDFMNKVWPTASLTNGTPSIPKWFTLLDNASIRFAPAPDASYTVEYVGDVRPDPLSSTNQQTYIATYYPDLFIAASMIYAAGWQRDFGAQADDPKLATSWLQNYKDLLPAAVIMEARKKSESAGWTAYTPTQTATPPRT